MFAIEFEADIKNGVVKIPEQYSQLQNGHAKVVVMVAQETIAEPSVTSLDLRSRQIPAFAEQDAVAVQREMRDAW